jgi:P27 family predicted phage terminase small subunit
MGERGSKRKPLERHKQEGTLRADRHLPDAVEAFVEPVKQIPLPPPHLSAGAVQYWNQVAATMADMGILANADLAILETLAMKLDIQRRAYDELCKQDLVLNLVNAKGGEFKMINPNSTILNTVTSDIIKITAQLGLSPAARTQIGVVNKKPDDPMKNFFKGK